jgi:hypothetical protein
MAAATSLALMAAGAASNTIGSYYTAKGQQTALRYQAEIADINARMSERSAQSELLRGQREEQASRLKTSHLKSTQRASMAANGIDLGQGSAAEILTTTDLMGEVDANTIAANAVNQAWGYRTQGVNFQNEALVKRSIASAINPGMSAATTLLGEAGRVATSWYAMDKAGAFTPSGVAAANKTADPIYSLGSSRGWWSK